MNRIVYLVRSNIISDIGPLIRKYSALNIDAVGSLGNNVSGARRKVCAVNPEGKSLTQVGIKVSGMESQGERITHAKD